MVDDATILTRAMRADLWLVQRDTAARSRRRRGSTRASRRAPRRCPACAGRGRTRISSSSASTAAPSAHRARGPRLARRPGALAAAGARAAAQQPHGEMIVDASLGLGIGESLVLAGEPYRVVGLTKNALTSGGDSVAFVSVADAQLIAFDQPAEATMLERQRVVERLRRTDLGRGQPGARGPRHGPALARPGARLAPRGGGARRRDPHRIAEVRRPMRAGATSASTRRPRRRRCCSAAWCSGRACRSGSSP
jgi:putative ABC transport system permease protein